MVINDRAFARFTATSDLLRPYVIRHFRSQDHGCRASLKRAMTVNDYVHIHSHVHTMHSKLPQVLITLTNIRGLNCSIHSTHQFFHSSLFAPFSIGIQIFPSSDSTQFQFHSYAFILLLFLNFVFVLSFIIQLPLTRYLISTFPMVNSNSRD